MPQLSSISTNLLVRLREHDPAAWRRLTALYGPEVYRWCRRTGLRPEDAADVSQEVFSAVAAKLGNFRRDRLGDSFRGWLWTITRNAALDFLRRQNAEPNAYGGSDPLLRLAEVPATEDGSTTAEVPGDTHGLLRRALELVREGFEERTWQAFWLTTVDGRPVADVAQELGIRPNAVYVARSRVLARLRAELGDLLN